MTEQASLVAFGLRTRPLTLIRPFWSTETLNRVRHEGIVLDRSAWPVSINPSAVGSTNPKKMNCLQF